MSIAWSYMEVTGDLSKNSCSGLGVGVEGKLDKLKNKWKAG